MENDAYCAIICVGCNKSCTQTIVSIIPRRNGLVRYRFNFVVVQSCNNDTNNSKDSRIPLLRLLALVSCIPYFIILSSTILYHGTFTS